MFGQLSTFGWSYSMPCLDIGSEQPISLIYFLKKILLHAGGRQFFSLSKDIEWLSGSHLTLDLPWLIFGLQLLTIIIRNGTSMWWIFTFFQNNV